MMDNIVSGGGGDPERSDTPEQEVKEGVTMVRSYSLSKLDPRKDYINVGTEDQMEIYGYKYDKKKQILSWVAYLLTIGMLRLVFHWRPDWMLRVTYRKCDLVNAEKLLLLDQYHQWFVEQVKLITKDGTSPETCTHHSKTWFGSGPVLFRRHLLEHQRMSPVTSEESQFLLSNPRIHHEQNYHDDSLIKFFVNKRVKYVWQGSTGFSKQKGLEDNLHCSYFHETIGLDITEQAQQRVLYGLNLIEVHVTPVIKLLFTEVLNPFYIFQIFSVILWYCDEYYYYASCIVVISGISVTVSVIQTRRMQRALKDTIQCSGIVNVCRGGNEYEDIPSDLLVPGDMIEIPRHGCVMQCDAVLISGKCIVNESMLTGESVPVTKTPIPNPRRTESHEDVMFNIKEHSRHILFCGTNVIQTRHYEKEKVRAIVVRTGFATTKGELVRSIMFPKPADFKFSQDIFKFLCVLALIAACGMTFTLVLMVMRGNHPGKIVLRTLDLVTIIIPPAMPAAMTFGVMFAQTRLKKQRIFCISPTSINVSGSINVVCFDKTGTLTEDGLDMWGVLPVTDNMFELVQHDPSLLPRGPMVAAMATCHSLTILEGELSGDPLDLKMFNSTNWTLEEPGEDTTRYEAFMPTLVHPKTPDIVQDSVSCDSKESIPFEIGIVRQFTFTSNLQRMSVIARTLGAEHFDLYAKGAPEMIAALSKPDTIPYDFHEVLMQYTQQGYRVLALAWRPLPKYSIVKVQRIQREQVECDLNFLGLLVMENRLKPETSPVISQLNDANLRTVMITGDNMLTALSVARDCGIVNNKDRVVVAHGRPPSGDQPASIEWMPADETHLSHEATADLLRESIKLQMEQDIDRVQVVLTGKTWSVIRDHIPEIIPKLGVCGTVLARMAPEQKAQFVEILQKLGYYVAMCGDGANDCGALKAAHTGISLSEAEASVASPFTAQEQNISCVPTVIREGRAALVTSFGIIKYMAMYSITQFCCVTLLYWIGANMTDVQFLWVDLFLLTILSIAFGYTQPYRDLAPEPPPISLLSLTPILSMLTQLVFIVGFQVFAWILVQQQPWFERFVPNEDDHYKSDENSALYFISSFQYVTLAILCSKGAPYRRTIFSNYFLLSSILLLTAVNVYVVMYPFPWLAEEFELKLPPTITYRALYVGMAALNFFASFLCETFVVDGPLIKKRCQDVLDDKYRRRHYEYVTVEEDLRSCPQWPPMSQSASNLAELMRSETTGSFATSTPSSETPGDLVDDTQLLLPMDKDKGCETANKSKIEANIATLLPGEVKADVHNDTESNPSHHKPNI